MSDLQQALGIFEAQFGRIGNIKFLLSDGMEIDSVASDLLALAQDVRDGGVSFHDSYPEPDLVEAA